MLQKVIRNNKTLLSTERTLLHFNEMDALYNKKQRKQKEESEHFEKILI